MKSRKTIFFGLLSILYFSTNCATIRSGNGNQESKDNRLRNEKRQWLKDYALCSCLYQGFPHDSFQKKDISLAAYAEISEYQPSTFAFLDSITREIVLHIRPSQLSDHQGKKAITLHCIQFYKSLRLDSIVRSFDTDLEINMR